MAEARIRVAVMRPVAGLFDYYCEEAVCVGARVRVPFGRQTALALVAKTNVADNGRDIKLKSVLEVLDDAAVVSAQLWRLLNFTARYYQYPIGEVVQAALPKLLRDGGKNTLALERYYSLTEAGTTQLAQKLGTKQRAVLTALMAGECSAPALKSTYAVSGAWLEDLRQRGWLKKREAFALERLPREAAPVLSEAQAKALSDLNKGQGFQVSVLDGVTGSGKTEVYIRYIEQRCRQGGQVLLLVPEIGLVQTMLRRLRSRLAPAVVALHSGMTDKQRLNSWQAIAAGEAQVLVGTRSAVFAVFANLVGIIVDEEHDPAYKQQDGLRYHGRDLAIMRANFNAIPIVLGSATPSLETYHHVQHKGWQALALRERVMAQSLPSVRIENIDQATMQDGLSVGLIKAMRQTLAQSEQVMLFLNRRGYAPVLSCEACGWKSDCEACDATMVAHTTTRLLLCHHCGRQKPLPVVCPACQQGKLQLYGMGTQRLEQVVVKQFPQARVLRIDSDAFSTHKQFEQALAHIQQGDADIILGTQWLSKGHHFPRLNLVAIIDADQAFYSLDFRSEERLAQMLVQVSGRAGRERAGRVWVQTRQPNHPVFSCLTEPYAKQAARLYQARQAAGLPPCQAQVLLLARHSNLERAMQALTFTKEGAQSAGIGNDWQWYGPAPAPIARKDGQHRAHLLIQASDKKTIQQALPALNAWLLAQGKALSVRCGIDVDPLWLE